MEICLCMQFWSDTIMHANVQGGDIQIREGVSFFQICEGASPRGLLTWSAIPGALYPTAARRRQGQRSSAAAGPGALYRAAARHICSRSRSQEERGSRTHTEASRRKEPQRREEPRVQSEKEREAVRAPSQQLADKGGGGRLVLGSNTNSK